MGSCKRTLLQAELEPRTITPSSYWGDLCEDIHLHLRNFRMDMSLEEFDCLYKAVMLIKEGVDRGLKEDGWAPGNPEYLKSFNNNIKLKRYSDYYPNRLKIELEKHGDIHFHYRDFRLHLTISEFKQLAKAMAEALKNLESDA